MEYGETCIGEFKRYRYGLNQKTNQVTCRDAPGTCERALCECDNQFGQQVMSHTNGSQLAQALECVCLAKCNPVLLRCQLKETLSPLITTCSGPQLDGTQKNNVSEVVQDHTNQSAADEMTDHCKPKGNFKFSALKNFLSHIYNAKTKECCADGSVAPQGQCQGFRAIWVKPNLGSWPDQGYYPNFLPIFSTAKIVNQKRAQVWLPI